MLAHELRNPLGTISSALQVLRMKGEGDDGTVKRAIDAAERQVLHQAMLIDDLLDVSRVTRGLAGRVIGSSRNRVRCAPDGAPGRCAQAR